ncbi:MAG: SDR family oxidoreductase, partial [Marinobacter sp.]
MSRFLTSPSAVWLTGATSGIGEALARRLIGDGHKLVVTGRRQPALDRLVSLAPNRVRAGRADTTVREDLNRLDPILEQTPTLNMAILNAGTCEYVDVNHFDSERIGHNIETNIMGTVRSIELALPHLRRSRSLGHPAALVIVGSSAWW